MRLKRPAARRKLASQPSVPRPNASRRPVRTPLRRSDVPKRSAPSRKPSVLLRKKLAQERKAAEEARLQAEARRQEEARLAEEKRLAEAKRAEEARIAEEKRQAEIQRVAAEKKAAEERRERERIRQAIRQQELARLNAKIDPDSQRSGTPSGDKRNQRQNLTGSALASYNARIIACVRPNISIDVPSFHPPRTSSSPNSSSGRCPTANLPALPSTRRSQAGMPTTRPYATPS